MTLSVRLVFNMQCDRCGLDLKEGEGYDLHGKYLCEDCYMYETNPPKACDPMAVSSALSMRKQLGQLGCSGLTELQQKIYNIVEKYGKITKEDLVKALNVKPEQLEQEFAFFRHCELLRAFREDGKIYFTKWETRSA
jgi:late competence protein required for DNA uptake (superfamily II DNA/RNA helicase)